MAIPLTTTGGVFRRLGRTWFLLTSLNGWRGTANLSAAGAVSLGTGIDNITGQYDSANQNLVDGLYSQRDQQRNSFPLPFALSALAANTVVQKADDDTICNPRTLQNALTILISQMVGSGDTVNANTVSVATATGGSNVGNAVIAASIKNAAGVLQEYVFAETLTAKCITDSQSGGTAGAEFWTLTGDLAATSGSLGWDWPAGSGASVGIQAKTASAGLLTNGSFETWTLTDIPDGWSIVVGTASATVFQTTSVVYRDSSALRILGNASELTSLRQQLTGLKPATIYCFNLFQRVSAVPAAGVLSIDLYDGSSIINDDAGTANQTTKALTASTTSYAALNGFFRTPSVLPANIYLRVRLTTALDSGKSVYIDELCLTTPVQTYAGGPYVAIFAGSTSSVKNDSFTVTVSNDWGGKLQTAAEAFFGMRNLGLQLPSNGSGSETIPDSLVY